ncbi:D-psicose/D-tagatose/L-ribulose 3-epimerase [Lachnospiraceae bacterium PF1-21]|uniref:D-psicose 3-epimerase n=1 Tax=Ohessyouella blattaphilus TaxID=2949333 RepID=UPI003E203AD7
MKIGIYCSYWEKEWGGNPIPFIKKVKDLGFDVLEVACADFDQRPDSFFEEMRAESLKYGIELTGGYGPIPAHNTASKEEATVARAIRFYRDIFRKMQIAGIKSLGGALYSYWPVDYASGVDKEGDTRVSIENMKVIADLAAEYDITLYMEALNRFEGYVINTAKEALAYVKEVDRSNVKVLLDTFHMNIEEDNLLEAIRETGDYLGELHVGEANRRPPLAGTLMSWEKIGEILNEIDFSGPVVMEPFVTKGGKVGADIKVWRNLLSDDRMETLDSAAGNSAAYLKKVMG